MVVNMQSSDVVDEVIVGCHVARVVLSDELDVRDYMSPSIQPSLQANCWCVWDRGGLKYVDSSSASWLSFIQRQMEYASRASSV